MITKTGLHAIRALTALARLPEGRCADVASVAEEIEAPPNYLGKLLGDLARAGLARSHKGPGGGFRLAQDPRSIRLLDVIETLEDLSRWSGCFLKEGKCTEDDPCAVHPRWARLRSDYQEMLTSTTIADLVRPGKRSKQ